METTQPKHCLVERAAVQGASAVMMYKLYRARQTHSLYMLSGLVRVLQRNRANKMCVCVYTHTVYIHIQNIYTNIPISIFVSIDTQIQIQTYREGFLKE